MNLKIIPKKTLVNLLKLVLVSVYIVYPYTIHGKSREYLYKAEREYTPPTIIEFSTILLEQGEINSIEISHNNEIYLTSNDPKLQFEDSILTVDLTEISQDYLVNAEFVDNNNRKFQQYLFVDKPIDKPELEECSYSQIVDIKKALVDKNNCINDDSIPLTKLVKLEYNAQIFRVHEEVHKDLVRLLKDAENDSLKLEINSAFRDIQEQQDLHELFKNIYGTNIGSKLSATPEQSEHHLGTAIDFGSGTSNSPRFEESMEYLWIRENGWKYGFVMSYPEYNQLDGDYMFEPWHWRYVGVEHATNLKKLEGKITLNQYLYIINNYNADSN